MDRQTPTRVELHRARYHFEGCVGKRLSLDELDEDSRRVFSEHLFFNIALAHGLRDPYEVLSDTLEEWGLSCVHPISMRKYAASGAWFCCGLCECSVVDNSR